MSPLYMMRVEEREWLCDASCRVTQWFEGNDLALPPLLPLNASFHGNGCEHVASLAQFLSRSSVVIGACLFALSRGVEAPRLASIRCDCLQELVESLQQHGLTAIDSCEHARYVVTNVTWMWSHAELIKWLANGQGPAHILSNLDKLTGWATIDLAYGLEDGEPLTLCGSRPDPERFECAIGYTDLAYYKRRNDHVRPAEATPMRQSGRAGENHHDQCAHHAD